MSIPSRQGISSVEFERLCARLDQARDRMFRKTSERTDLGGEVVIWYRGALTMPTSRLVIQPGVADDLASLLSALAAEIAWPGVGEQTSPGQQQNDARKAIAVWARVWQVREHADLRVALHWDQQGHFIGHLNLRSPEGVDRPYPQEVDLTHMLNRVAVKPQTSESPHGMVIVGNRALEAGDYLAARACFERALKDLPNHPEAHRNLALALAHLDEWDHAAEEMHRAWQLSTHDAALTQEYIAVETDAGIYAVQAHEYEHAADHFLRILSHWPDDPTALANLGNVRLREGRQREAKAIFRRFLRLHPDHAAANDIRLALAELGDTEA
ncbi:MAG TPA: tetratricopeptide repeat protein [Armatimonadota bacterium]|nr:tetratricopeptide repeat protein [Armatimonadota bacterium]